MAKIKVGMPTLRSPAAHYHPIILLLLVITVRFMFSIAAAPSSSSSSSSRQPAPVTPFAGFKAPRGPGLLLLDRGRPTISMT